MVGDGVCTNIFLSSGSVPGPPLSNETAITELMKHGVNVALQVFDEPTARNTRFDAAWVGLSYSLLAGVAINASIFRLLLNLAAESMMQKR